ncbi:MAG: hypothetical protein KJ601_07965, partial [Nanoarchaeota archaeon]|nr:hypothetical protein [Nanoarchaeota archaeon]MBU1703965.1 hypothetical protein [Nanoarchaeota archaeon]
QLESRVMGRIVKSRFPKSFCYHDGSLGVYDITEVCTQVCDNIADLSDNLILLYRIVKKALKPDEHIVATGYVAERVLGTHVNLGAGSAEEACYLMNAFRQHLPELVSLSLNSGRIYYEGVCAEFPDVLDLSMLNYVKQFTKKLSSGLSDPIMLSPKSTVEIRCFDSQQAPEQDVALAAYTFAIHQYAREHFPHYPLDRPFLKAMYGQASRVGVEAVVNGNQVRDWIKETLDTVQPEPAYFKPLLGKI